MNERRRQFQPAGGRHRSGTGSDTVLTQRPPKILAALLDDFITYSSDTDFTPFDVGADQQHDVHLRRGGWVEAASQVADQIKAVAGRDVEVPGEEIMLAERRAWAADGRSVTRSRRRRGCWKPCTTASNTRSWPWDRGSAPTACCPSCAVRGGGPRYRDRTGDGGEAGDGAGLRHDRQPGGGRGPDRRRHDPGAGLCRVRGDALRLNGPDGKPAFWAYRIFAADEMPEMQVRFVQTYEPTHPFGVKAVAEIPLDGVAARSGERRL